MLRTIFIFTVLPLALSGCYSFSQTTLPPHLRTLTVLPAENRTTQSVLGDQITAAVQETFKRNAPSLRQIPEGGQAEFEITLTNYRNSPASFSNSGLVNAYQVAITVDVRFRDLTKNRDIYARKGLSAQGVYDISKGETEEMGQSRALKDLKEILVNNALSDW